MVNVHVVFFDALHGGLQQHPDASGLLLLLQLRSVLLLDTRKSCAAVGQRDVGPLFPGQRNGRLQGTVATTHHQHRLSRVLCRVGQPVGHLGRLFAGHLQLARRATPAHGQQHGARGVAATVGLHHKVPILAFDRLHALPKPDLQAGLLHHALPEFQQRFLLHLVELDLADQVQLHRCRHRDLLSGVVVDRAPQRVLLLDELVAHLVVDGGQAGGQPGRAAANDEHVEFGLGAFLLADRVHGLAALLGGLADQPHATEFAGNEDARHIGLEVRRHVGNVDAALLGAKHQLDGLHRAGRHAGAVPDAGRRVDQHRLAIDHAQRPFRAGLGAGPRAHAAARIHHRVQRRWLHQTGLHGLLQFGRVGGVDAPLAPQVQGHHQQNDGDVDQDVVHGSNDGLSGPAQRTQGLLNLALLLVCPASCRACSRPGRIWRTMGLSPGPWSTNCCQYWIARP